MWVDVVRSGRQVVMVTFDLAGASRRIIRVVKCCWQSRTRSTIRCENRRSRSTNADHSAGQVATVRQFSEIHNSVTPCTRAGLSGSRDQPAGQRRHPGGTVDPRPALLGADASQATATADPEALAEFYRQATGFEVHTSSGPEFVGLNRKDGLFLGFQRVDDYQPPQWPGQILPQQSHLDFRVDDLDQAEAQLLDLGATKPAYQPDEGKWRVLADPAGHPFCLTLI
jgi:predicted enzyme related to lactoylglutathione lyase